MCIFRSIISWKCRPSNKPEGVLPKKLGRGVPPASQNFNPIYDQTTILMAKICDSRYHTYGQNLRFSLPCLWPKSVILPTILMTKICNSPFHTYDQNLRFSLPYLWPKSAIFPTILMTKICDSPYHTYDQNLRFSRPIYDLFMTWPKIWNPIYDLIPYKLPKWRKNA